MITTIRTAFVSLILFTVLFGFIYPTAVTGIAQLAFPRQANGSIILQDGKAVGSELIGQQFSDPKYFWTRPSATTPYPYNASSSSASNYGQSNPDLIAAVQKRIDRFRAVDPSNRLPVPVDMVTASGSGLDPHISPAAAEYQVKRVAKARGLDETEVRAIMADFTEGRRLGLLGEPVVNVLKLNLALDRITKKP